MNPAETLSGTYGTASIKLPDGTEVPIMVRRVPKGDGTYGWVVMDDATLEFERRYADTTTVPADQPPPGTGALDKNTITVDDTTKRLVSGDLIQFLGDPDRILAQKGLDPERLAHLKAHPASVTMARRLCKVAGAKWLQVLQYVPTFYPETRP